MQHCESHDNSTRQNCGWEQRQMMQSGRNLESYALWFTGTCRLPLFLFYCLRFVSDLWRFSLQSPTNSIFIFPNDNIPKCLSLCSKINDKISHYKMGKFQCLRGIQIRFWILISGFMGQWARNHVHRLDGGVKF